MRALFVAGSGTDIGKTWVTAALVRALRARGRTVTALKPLASGVPPIDDPAFAESDTGVLLAASGLAITAETVAACSPWRFAAPLAPDMAAAAEGRVVALAEVVAWTRAAIDAAPADATVLVEGVGGVMSPTTADATGLDWLAALKSPALLVAGSYLGAISHALTAVAALQARGIPLAGVAVNESAGSTVSVGATVEAVRRFLPGATVTPTARDGDATALAALLFAAR